MPIEVKYYDANGTEEPFNPEQPLHAFTAVVDTTNNRPLVLLTNGSQAALPKRPKESEIEKQPAHQRAALRSRAYRATVIAKRGIVETRRQARYGPLNNAMPAYGEQHGFKPYTSDEDNRPTYFCEPIPPAILYDDGEQLEHSIAYDGGRFRGLFAHMLARFYRGIRTGSGVCSTLSAIGAGLMSMYSMPMDRRGRDRGLTLDNFIKDEDPQHYLSIINLSHKADHSFNLVSYRGSPWFVSDPWPAEPYVIEPHECHFSVDSLKVWSEIRVYAHLKDPFGLPLLNAWADNHDADANAVTGLQFPPASLRDAWDDYADGLMTEDRLQAFKDNLEPFMWLTEKKSKVYARILARDPGEGWWPNLDALKRAEAGVRMRRDYHTKHPWEHLTNLKTDKLKDDETDEKCSYSAYRRKHPPVLFGDQWGDTLASHGGSGGIAKNERPAAAE